MMHERLKPGLFCSSSLTQPIAMLPKNVTMHSKFSELLTCLIQFYTLEGVVNGTDTRTVNWSYIGLILKALQVIVINLP